MFKFSHNSIVLTVGEQSLQTWNIQSEIFYMVQQTNALEGKLCCSKRHLGQSVTRNMRSTGMEATPDKPAQQACILIMYHMCNIYSIN